MFAKNAESALAGPGCQLSRQPRQPINSETEFAKASQGLANEFIIYCKGESAGRGWWGSERTISSAKSICEPSLNIIANRS